MNFSKNYSETVEFLDDFRSKALSKSGHRNAVVSVDLSVIDNISIAVAIVLAADFHRWSIVQGVKLQPREIKNWNSDVVSLFNSLGIFDLLGLPDQKSDGGSDNFFLLPLASGLRTEGEKIHQMQAGFEHILHGFTGKPALYEGLIEATENAIMHAYPSDYQPKHTTAGHRWWCASCLDMQKEILRFFVYDQGAGIPYTLPRSGVWEGILQFAAKLGVSGRMEDGVLLDNAFEVGRTATLETHRGLGLKKMLDVTNSSNGCQFRVLSGRGEVRYKDGNLIEKFTHKGHVGGTLIEWRIPSNVFISNDEDPAVD